MHFYCCLADFYLLSGIVISLSSWTASIISIFQGHHSFQYQASFQPSFYHNLVLGSRQCKGAPVISLKNLSARVEFLLVVLSFSGASGFGVGGGRCGVFGDGLHRFRWGIFNGAGGVVTRTGILLSQLRGVVGSSSRRGGT